MRAHDYELCEKMLNKKFGITHVIWAGWAAPVDMLIACDWVFTYRPAYHNWKDVRNTQSHEYIYVRHEPTKMMGRITVTSLDDGVASLDYFTPERNRRVKPNPVFDTEALTVEDVPALLDVILKLQSEYPKMPEKVQPTVMAMIA